MTEGPRLTPRTAIAQSRFYETRANQVNHATAQLRDAQATTGSLVRRMLGLRDSKAVVAAREQVETATSGLRQVEMVAGLDYTILGSAENRAIFISGILATDVPTALAPHYPLDAGTEIMARFDPDGAKKAIDTTGERAISLNEISTAAIENLIPIFEERKKFEDQR